MNLLQIKNFKCFSEIMDINLSNITVNVGMNSVGKSTCIQALLLLRTTYEEIVKYHETAKTELIIPLNDSYALQLGYCDQIISDGTENIEISINGDRFVYTKSSDQFHLKYINEKDINELSNVFFFSPKFYYLNAERQGPRNYQLINHLHGELCGWHGETTFNAIDKYGNKAIEIGRRREGNDCTVNILSKQIEYWMDYIAPGVQFKTVQDTDTLTARMKIRQTTLDTDFMSPHSFGFGISYLLPIIVTGLLAESGSTIIIENPEAHLHPYGQSRIGYFLAQVAHSGVSVIIETHSEHIVNGIRVYALKKRMNPDNICINYFSIQDRKPSVERLPVNQQMDILKWPDGFFDQEERDLSELRHLRRRI